MAVSSAILHYTLATAGHAGHGKSALVKALTGMPSQSRPSQPAAGVNLPMAVARLGKYELDIVDPPGHEDRVGELLIATASIHFVLLVVAADQGWERQTEEHLQILTYLGIHRGVVALTKVDLVKDPSAILADIKNRLAGTSLAEAPIVPTSVLRASTVANLKKIVVEMVSRTPPQVDLGKPRLAVDCVSAASDGGIVVSGALRGGSLVVGQEVLVVPGGARSRIAAAQCYNRQLQTIRPASRVDLHLSGLLPAGQAASDAAVGCGDVITVAGVELSTRTLDVQLSRLPRSIHPAEPPPSLLQDQAVNVYCGGVVAARLHLLDVDELPAGQKALARLTLDKPLMALAYDRLVIRDASQRHTLAGGIVLDADPPQTSVGPSLQRQLILLRLRADSPPLPPNYIASQLARDGVARRDDLLLRCPFSKDGLDGAIARLLAEKSIIMIQDIIADASWWQELARVIVTAVDAHHRDHPDKTGLPLTEVRPLAAASLPLNVEALSRPVIDALLDELCRGELARNGAVLARRGHQAGPSRHQQEACQDLLRRLDDSLLDPPPRAELCQGRGRMAMKLLLTGGQAIELSADVVVSAQSYADAVEAIREQLRNHGPATTSELMLLLSSTRRVVVPLLERMDREKITRREGTRRHLVT